MEPGRGKNEVYSGRVFVSDLFYEHSCLAFALPGEGTGGLSALPVKHGDTFPVAQARNGQSVVGLLLRQEDIFSRRQVQPGRIKSVQVAHGLSIAVRTCAGKGGRKCLDMDQNGKKQPSLKIIMSRKCVLAF